MNEKKLSVLQKEYRAFFRDKMHRYNVTSPADLRKENKSDFFNEIKRDWAEYKFAKQQIIEANIEALEILEEPEEFIESDTVTFKGSEKQAQPIAKQYKSNHKGFNQTIEYDKSSVAEEGNNREISKQIIKSEPNREQTDDLRIQFNPNSHFEQGVDYLYPVVKMPNGNAILKLPRNGRSNQKGYKEHDFFKRLRQNISDLEMTNDAHIVIPNFNRPYEPDIVIFDKKLNLYVDVEIDEPYDGYYRYPTHYINLEDEAKQDNIRDLFFTESGWIVIRFTEKQVHCQPQECIDYIRSVIDSVNNRIFNSDSLCNKEHQWDYNKCIQWQKAYYREKYLGIERFKKQYSLKEIEIDVTEQESVENAIQRTKKFQLGEWNNSISFDEETHKYIHPKDETGNAEYISVTSLIERFFPFDLKRYIERKAQEENRSEDDVLDEYLLIRDEASAKGTNLHEQTENYLKGHQYDSEFPEFKIFQRFYEREIVSRNLQFFDAEKRIFTDQFNVAGTIDCLFKKFDQDEYVMLDWKRSKKLIIDGRPRIFGFGYALAELNHLDNSSYNRYCLQQNIYKRILETEYSIRISSMKLIVLHENYENYYVVDVPLMKRETDIILNSLKCKI